MRCYLDIIERAGVVLGVAQISYSDGAEEVGGGGGGGEGMGVSFRSQTEPRWYELLPSNHTSTQPRN